MNLIDEFHYMNYNRYLRKQFGGRVFRISLDAGFRCPKQAQCTYCDDEGSGNGALKKNISLREQMERGMQAYRTFYKAEKFIAYFQSYTNTLMPIDKLKQLYDTPLFDDTIIGLDIATRPDCIDESKIDLIARYTDRYIVWIEYGLQSAHNRTLERVKRGHTVEQTVDAIAMTKNKGIKIGLHVILGLPGETYDDMMATADFVARLDIDGIKIHMLHIVRGSAMEQEYSRGEITLFERNEYVKTVCDFLERLPKNMFIQRLTGERTSDKLVAPLWCMQKAPVIQAINNELVRRKSYQGRIFG